ncbi:MAG: DUF4358 domain-containing protein [Ruminococcus sp.]|jgi:hypothetical protein|nr:DUF4358 domain-containing protein [Ruminococcus sp.]
MKKLTLYTLLILLICGLFISCGKKDDEKKGKDIDSAASVSDSADKDSEYSLKGSLRGIVPEIAPAPAWKALNEIYDNDLISEFFGLENDNPNYAELTIWQCGLSTVVEEIILIKAADGKTEDAVADLNKRRDRLINVDTFYPDDKATAEKSLVGNLGDYCYFIAGENANSALENLKLVLTGKSVPKNSDSGTTDNAGGTLPVSANGNSGRGTRPARANIVTRATVTLPEAVKSAMASIQNRNESQTKITQSPNRLVTRDPDATTVKSDSKYKTQSERKALYSQIAN